MDVDTCISKYITELRLVMFCRPSGWDNLNKISILYENMHSCKAEDYYSDVIVAPQQRKVDDRQWNIIILSNL